MSCRWYMLLECRVQYKQRYRSHVNSKTVSDHSQFLTDTAGKDKLFWTLLLLHGDKAHSLWQRVTWGVHSHGAAQGTEAAWLLRPLTSFCPSLTHMCLLAVSVTVAAAGGSVRQI